MKWDLTGVSNGDVIYKVFYFKNGSKIVILSKFFEKNNVNDPIDFVTENNPFEANRLNGHLKLINGDGTLTFTISNVQYNESGVYVFTAIIASGNIIEKEVNSTLDIRGMFWNHLKGDFLNKFEINLSLFFRILSKNPNAN